MINFFQSIGIVFTLVIAVVLAIAAMYLSYIVAIALLLSALTYIVYNLLSTVKQLPT